MPPVLRAARPDEARALGALCLRSKGHWGYDAAFLEACRSELALTAHDLDELLCVAEVDDVVAGLVQLAHDDADWHLDKLFVDPPFIGTGIGGVLLRWAAAVATDHGATRLVIEADPGAADFYRRLGAVDDGVVASGSIPGRFLPRLVLPLPLRSTSGSLPG